MMQRIHGAESEQAKNAVLPRVLPLLHIPGAVTAISGKIHDHIGARGGHSEFIDCGEGASTTFGASSVPKEAVKVAQKCSSFSKL